MSKIILDLSYHNGNVDFSRVKKTGVYGFIQRLGYGIGNIDVKARNNINEGLKNNLKVGGYWFSYAYTENMAIQEGLCCVEFLKLYKGKLELPIFFDFEYDSDRYSKKCLGRSLTVKERTNIVKKFCNVLSKHGWYVGNYANLDYVNNKFYQSELNHIDLWIAKWSDFKPNIKHTIWQYTEKGYCEGVNGFVDKNFMDIDYPSIIRMKGYNGFNSGNGSNSSNTDCIGVERYIQEFAKHVMIGEYGNGSMRKENIYKTVQQEVNNIVKGGNIRGDYVSKLANDVINGMYGNSISRKNNIYNSIQNCINLMTK